MDYGYKRIYTPKRNIERQIWLVFEQYEKKLHFYQRTREGIETARYKYKQELQGHKNETRIEGI